MGSEAHLRCPGRHAGLALRREGSVQPSDPSSTSMKVLRTRTLTPLTRSPKESQGSWPAWTLSGASSSSKFWANSESSWMVRDRCLACLYLTGKAKVGTEGVVQSGELRASSCSVIKPGELDLLLTSTKSTSIGSPHQVLCATAPWAPSVAVPWPPWPWTSADFIPMYWGKECLKLSLSSYSSSWIVIEFVIRVIWAIWAIWLSDLCGHGLPLSAPAVRESPWSVPLGIEKGGAFRLTGSQGGWLRKNDMGSDAHLKWPRRQVRPGALCKSKPENVRSACGSSSTSMNVFRTWTLCQVLSNPGGIPGPSSVSHGWNDMRPIYLCGKSHASCLFAMFAILYLAWAWYGMVLRSPWSLWKAWIRMII